VFLDLPLLLFFDFSGIWIQTIIAHLTKLLSAYGGALVARRQVLKSAGEVK
jgi:hypothetical protein